MNKKKLIKEAEQLLNEAYNYSRDYEKVKTMAYEYSFEDVLEAVADICLEKADHIRDNYADENLAEIWDEAGYKIDAESEVVEKLEKQVFRRSINATLSRKELSMIEELVDRNGLYEFIKTLAIFAWDLHGGIDIDYEFVELVAPPEEIGREIERLEDAIKDIAIDIKTKYSEVM